MDRWGSFNSPCPLQHQHSTHTSHPGHSRLYNCVTALQGVLAAFVLLVFQKANPCVGPPQTHPSSLHQLRASRGLEVTSGAQLESVSLLVIRSADACLSGVFSDRRRSNYAAAAPGRTWKRKFRDSVDHTWSDCSDHGLPGVNFRWLLGLTYCISVSLSTHTMALTSVCSK